MSAASITDYRNNVLKRSSGEVVARAGHGLSLQRPDRVRRQGRRPARRGRRPAARLAPLPGRPRLPRARVRPRQGGRRAHLARSTGCGATTTRSSCSASASTRATGRWCRSGSAPNGTPEAVTLLPARGRRGPQVGGRQAFTTRPPDHLRRAALARRATSRPERIRTSSASTTRTTRCRRSSRTSSRSARGGRGPAAGATRPASAAASSAAAARPARARQGQKWDHPNAWHQRGRGGDAVAHRPHGRPPGSAARPTRSCRSRRTARGRPRARRVRARHGAAAARVAAARHAPQGRRRAPAAGELTRSAIQRSRRRRRGAGPAAARPATSWSARRPTTRCVSAAIRSRPRPKGTRRRRRGRRPAARRRGEPGGRALTS